MVKALPGFSLLLIIKYKKREVNWSKNHQPKNTRTSQLQKKKNEKACSGENSKGVTGQRLLKRLQVWPDDPASHPSKNVASLN